MKILFVSNFNFPDTMNDMVFHGLRSLYGEDVVDSNEAWYMYDDYKSCWNDRIPDCLLFKQRFTLYGKLPKLIIDRTDILKKIQNKYFDRIVYGSVCRCRTYLIDVHKVYPQNQVILIDGEHYSEDNYKYDRRLLSSGGKYYKSELDEPSKEALPINFCIPKELIVPSISEKTQDWATYIPGENECEFVDEKSYYSDYQKSYFAGTTKGKGWEQLKHYEILMNGCIPYFPNLNECPPLTMTRFPKQLILETNQKLESGEELQSFYGDYANRLLEYTRNNLTTEIVAQGLL